MFTRKRTLLIVPAAAALAIGLGISPASAAAGLNGNSSPNCVGYFVSNYNQYGPGYGGHSISSMAQEGGLGQYARYLSKC